MSSPEAPTEAPADAAAEPEPEAPRDEAREALLAELTTELGDAIVGSHLRAGDDLWVRVRADAWRDTGAVLRHKLRFGFFDFLAGIDWLPSPFGRDMDSDVDNVLQAATPKDPGEMATGVAGGETRFQVLARVCSIPRLESVTLKVDVPPETLQIDSWVPIYAGANWHERETWEMYGISFTGHPHLVHIYLPGEFEGFPLRKDFPLLARRVKPWPGIVDVEPMPGGGDDEGEGEAS